MESFNLEALTERIKHVTVKTASALRELLAAEVVPSDAPLGAHGRLEALFDEGTFSEVGTYVRRRPSEFDTEAGEELESVICGWGAVRGRLVYAFSHDMARTSGAVSEAHAAKICEIYRLAMQNGAPVVGIFDSAGALIPEGVRALAGYGSIMKAAAAASGVIPQIAVVPGYSSGSSAVICGMFDVVIACGNGTVSVNPPFLADGTVDASSMAETGVAAMNFSDELSAITAAADILAYLPSNNEEGAPFDLSGDSVNRQVTLAGYRSTQSAAELIGAIADDGRFTELYPDYAPEIVTGLISVGGISAGVIATNRSVSDGVLTARGARKASRMISLLDGFNLPIITVVDSRGLDRSTSSEASPYTAELAKLAAAYASATSPMVTLIAGEAYGSVFTVMGSKSLGADIVLALDSAKIAAMSAESAVAFLWNDKISESISRQDLERVWNESVATPVEAASSGEIDDIISESETRQRVGAALSMLSSKSTFKSSRKHMNMPL